MATIQSFGQTDGAVKSNLNGLKKMRGPRQIYILMGKAFSKMTVCYTHWTNMEKVT